MAYGFACTVCGWIETAHAFPKLYRCCASYMSPAPQHERWLCTQEELAEAKMQLELQESRLWLVENEKIVND